ncbi:coproporphyrinogen dehydrogenase HemZ [Eisenbergiella massiliensis]|uniref:coproporphyrinogen dehydrogenase HemZ n=1 Tax=Eisenbergiella massiliensis TaxID=1720294 RepID=UPI000C8490E1|nr:coproporphyrinogen dehydrogenase HemZ [Eisenbergiella massiliensis]
MLAVRLNKPQFEYDIHSIVKAFYPAETVKVFEEGTKDFESDGDNPSIAIWFEERAIRVNLSGTEHEAVLSRPEERPVVKNELKQLLYRVLSAYTGKELPWGTLTGIRPTKIAMQFLEENAPGTQNPMTEADILSYMQETYYCSEEKALLAIDIAKREKRILADIHYEKDYSLYIGIPFCPTTCLYCSFTSFPIFSWKDRVGEYLTALEKEIDFVREACQDKILDSVYIGGGTPTTLEPEELRRLLSKVRASFDFSQVKEFTVEAGRADSITRDKLRALKEFGVTRISVNPQTMNQETLNIIGRRHTVGQVEEAFRLAREEGFTNINMDLILGLPGETKEHVERTMEAVTRLCPDSLTVHSLAIKRASRLSLWIEENGIETLHNTDETMEIAAEGAARMNMKPYYLYRQKNMSGNFENVGYATEGNYGIYNILIMEEKQTIMALGAGTISKAVYPDGRIERCDNVKDVALYIEKIDEMIDRKRKLLGG